MDTSKVIITNKKRISNQYSFENELGLSSYDLALISVNEISKRSKSFINESLKTTYLI
tara:strand:+ start:361 stop:534 length:174 start_codon:yes stop_codon:yes gene_type:complete